MIVIKAVRVTGENGGRDSVEPETQIPDSAVRVVCDEEAMTFTAYMPEDTEKQVGKS